MRVAVPREIIVDRRLILWYIALGNTDHWPCQTAVPRGIEIGEAVALLRGGRGERLRLSAGGAYFVEGRMYKLGCNWSEALGALLAEGRVDVDYVKYGVYPDYEERFEQIRPLKPILLHGLGCFDHAGMREPQKVDFHLANARISACGSPHYGLHMAIQNVDMDAGMTEAGVRERLLAGVRTFKGNIAVPLLVENTPDSPQDRTVFDHHPYAEAERLADILEATGAGLLLDLTHAKITARYRGWDVHDFLSALPLERVREIHVNGSGHDENGFPADTHQAMEGEDFALLEWTLARSAPEIVTLEYNGIRGESGTRVRENLIWQLAQLGGSSHG